MAGIRFAGVILCSFLAFVSSSQKHEIQDCTEVRNTFVDKNIGPGDMVPDNMVRDSEMDICFHGLTHPNRKSCCTRAMEHRYHQAVERDFRSAIHSTSAYLKNLLHTNTVHYQEKFMEMIVRAENNTDALFSKVYKIPLRERWGPLENLFLDLKSYISKLEENISIQDSVLQFFDEIFPLVFKHILNNLGNTDLPEDYRLCLMEVRKELHQQPFGEYPNRLAHNLAKSLGSARDFLRALTLSVEVINTTDHLTLEHRCSKALTKLSHCAQCQALTTLRPCNEYCHNVMRGCLADVSDLDQAWNSFTDNLDTMTSNMRGTYSIEEVMRTVHAHISDAIMNSLEAGPKFYPKIVEKCGQPQGNNKDSDNHLSSHQKPNAAKFKSSWDSQKPDLHTKLSMFMRTVIASKGFYSSLPDTLCTAEKFSAGAGRMCWNGQSEGIYNKSVVANNLAEQRASNPEFRVAEETPEVIAELKDKLIKMTEQLSARVTSEMAYQGDDGSLYDTVNTGRGGDRKPARKYYQYDDYYEYSGHGSTYPNDDEDYDFSGSGSGDGYGSQGHTNIRTGPKRPGPQRNPGHENDDWGFSDNNSPYVTQRPAGAADSQQGNGNGAAHIAASSTAIVLAVMTIAMWRNG